MYRSISGEEIEYSDTWEYRRLADEKVLILYGYTVIPEKRDTKSFTPINVKKRGIGKLLIPLARQELFWFVKQPAGYQE